MHLVTHKQAWTQASHQLKPALTLNKQSKLLAGQQQIL